LQQRFRQDGFSSQQQQQQQQHADFVCCPRPQVTLPARFLTTTAHLLAILTVVIDVVSGLGPSSASAAAAPSWSERGGQPFCCRGPWQARSCWHTAKMQQSTQQASWMQQRISECWHGTLSRRQQQFSSRCSTHANTRLAFTDCYMFFITAGSAAQRTQPSPA
jgi:hypothetical protein